MSHALPDPPQALDLGVVDTPARPGPLVTERACAVCGLSLAGRRPGTVTCSSRHRSALARLRRREDLIARIRRSEAALREAADALASLKELAGLDATLELGALVKGRAS